MSDLLFLGVDGETIRDRYVLFGAGRDHLLNKRGLKLPAVLDWLAERSEGRILVGFYLHYDFCMMMKDEPDERILDFSTSAKFTVGGWEVQYVPRRFMEAKRGRERVTIYDCWEFYGTSFERSMEKMGIPESADIKWGKRNRATFKMGDLPRIIRYNQQECLILERMCEKLRVSMRSIGVNIKTWYGPGALAADALRTGEINRELGPRQIRAVMENPVYSAYFGGRIETLKIGRFEDATIYDVTSAYPEACLHLWDLNGKESGYWQSRRHFQPDCQQSFWFVEWNLPDDTYIGPLPFRRPDGRIYFPQRGRGWYWWPEVSMAIRLHGPHIKVHWGWVRHGATPSRMREIVPALFDKRTEMLRANRDIEQHLLKITLNSLYGKFAQSVSAHKDRDGKPIPPVWHSRVWAGYVTSWVRAKLRLAVYGHEHDVIGFATDGLIVRGTASLDLPHGLGLGQWKSEKHYSGWVLGSGIYRLENPGGSVRHGERGGPMDWKDVLGQLKKQSYAIVKDTRFVSPMLSLLQPEVLGPYRCKFHEFERRLAPWWDPKAKRHYQFQAIMDWDRDWADSEMVNGWPGEDSEPFEPRWLKAEEFYPKLRNRILQRGGLWLSSAQV